MPTSKKKLFNSETMSCSKPSSMLLFLLAIFFRFSDTTPCPEIEKQALLSFKQSLEDPSNLLASWNVDDEANCCSWKGVACSNSTGHVHQLQLQNHGLSQGLHGKLNHSLLSLKQLKYLDLSHNNFQQTIPSFIGSFPSLEYLNLSYAGFHGLIPRTIGNLSKLRTLSLEDQYPSLLVDRLEWLSRLSRLERLNMNSVHLGNASDWVQVIGALPLVELHFSGCMLDLIDPTADVNLTSLAILDLSYNEFSSLVIPGWIFQLPALIFLDLSMSNFEGPIPSISKSMKLQHFDLSYNHLNSTIPDWVYFCKHLEFVSLRYNQLQNTISDAIGNLTSLTTFDLRGNELFGKIPREIAGLCKLQYLDLSFNKLQGKLIDSFRRMSDCFLASLEYLNLRGNGLSGRIPDQFGRLKSLQMLDLGFNKLTGNLPESMGQLLNLESLYIHYNNLEGTVTESYFTNLTKLEQLYASRNHLSMKVSRNWIAPFRLTALTMRSWSFGAGSPVPSWIDSQKNVDTLDLSDTGISGSVPIWFWGIRYLNLSHNHLHGKIPDLHDFPVVDQLIYLSSNRFTGSLPRVSDGVSELDLSNNSLSGDVYHFLCSMNQTYSLETLHLGGNQLTGELPDCWTQWPSLRYLNLGNNKMFGSIPDSIGFLPNLVSLNLYGNKFSGQIPFFIHNCTFLQKIDLSSNDLSGNIPEWMGTSLRFLKYLILRSNKFSGEISPDICHLSSLQILDLARNNISGRIPGCVENFTAMATKRSSIEYSLSYSYYPGVFIESAVIGTKGNEYSYDTILSLVTSVDLSDNNFSGEIPEELTSLVELRSLNLSGNQLTGVIPSNIGDMEQLESLDLSWNSLLGEIPSSFAVMSSLEYMNLSYNYLTGRIPESTQLMTMNASSFIGNDLCGPPLPDSCNRGDGETQGPLHKEDAASEIQWFYVLLCLGYAVGFSVICTILVVKKSWREAYFGLFEFMWNKN